MPGVAVIDSGNYDLQVATGFNVDALVLDDPIKGKMGGYNTVTTRTNLILNPNFEINTNQWLLIGAGTTITRTTSDDYIGTASLQVDVSGTVAAAGASTSGTAGFRIPVTAGIPYMFSAYVKVPAGQPSVPLRLRTSEFQANGTQNAQQVSGTTTVTNTDGWVRLSYADTPTAGATPTVSMALRVELASAVGSARVYLVDAVLAEQSSSVLSYFDGTFAEPYTGYTLTTQTWNGLPDEATSTAKWGLNSSYISSDYVLDGTTEFASVMDGCIGISVKRGRRDVGDQFSAGTMSFTLNDTLAGGVFNPFDTDSPYYDTAQSKPGLAPMREVRLIRYDTSNVAQYLFKGYVVNYDYNFALGGIDTVTVYCADQFYLLAQTYLDELNVTAETSGERIETVLDLPEVDFPLADRDIATGTVNLGHDAAYTVPAGTNVLQYISQINSTAEFGRLFMSADGKLTFQDRIGNTFSASVADFHDDGTNIPYTGVGISFEADAVVNRTVVTGLNGNTAIASNATSIATYFIQTNSITNSLLHEQPSIDTAATYLLNGEPEARYTSVETDFLMLTNAQRDTVASIEIGNTITVEKTFPSGTGTTELAQELSVEGIEHTISVASGHSIMLSTSPTTIVFELILDNATYGTLDSTNALG
jgi:hypothetical protein